MERPGESASPQEWAEWLVSDSPGRDALWGWFGLSYASWLTLPRVLMHTMPDDWQRKMALLLHEFDCTFPNPPDLGTRVQLTKDGRLVKAQAWLEYRHPDHAKIESFMKPAAAPGEE